MRLTIVGKLTQRSKKCIKACEVAQKVRTLQPVSVGAGVVDQKLPRPGHGQKKHQRIKQF